MFFYFIYEFIIFILFLFVVFNLFYNLIYLYFVYCVTKIPFFFFRQNANVPSTVVTSIPESITENSNAFIKNTTLITQTTTVSGISSDSICLSKTGANKATKSVAAQMALEELLDEIDVNLVLESAVRRCSPEKLLLHYKVNTLSLFLYD